MLVISSREFRQNQKLYFDMVDNNEQVLVQRGKDKAYRILPVEQKDFLLSEEDYFKKLDASIKQIQEGNFIELSPEKQKELLGL